MSSEQTRCIEGLTVTCKPLPPMRSLDLVPELAGLFEHGAGAENDVDMLIGLARGLAGGKLRSLLPQLLASTKVITDTAGKPTTVTLNSPEMIDLAFDGHMKAFIPTVAFALEVSFRDFFEGGAQAVRALRAPSA